ncbi:glutamate-cysteine ligase family protein [Streptococcus sanguinis]|uniref:glutamate--cysteine ligase n=1 Tax=Streptococcus sanguinis TaxID=1305 RepID=A0A7H8V369_STRSA|nr:glutamate-cysteine ligase family protein [Streptococcus sanguinis]QLB50967.1 gamma-glutamylcysteine synthetase [Streptococcus sanguinis]
MINSIQILKERYLKNIKENPTVYIGIELEFPIVNSQGGATDTNVAKNLLKRLLEEYDFEVERFDRDGNPIQLKSTKNEDRILFEVSYNTLEFAFAKASRIQEVEERFKNYLNIIQPILREEHHEIQGEGIHPFWSENDNSPVKYPRYEMLMQYLAMGKNMKGLHNYPEYGAFICGSQVQLDVSRENYLSVINVFNQIEAVKAYLFANSEFSDSSWDTKIARDIFWEQSMHGILQENAGVNSKDFQTEDEFFAYLDRSALFTAEREGTSYYFYPIAANEYLSQKTIEAYSLSGEKVNLTPREADFRNHRSYQYQDLTTRGTVEFRSVCTQPFEKTFASAAFHLGILENLENVKAYLQDASFFQEEGRDYKALRRKFSKKELTASEREHIYEFTKTLLQLARAGLLARQLGEEVYLPTL